MGPSCRRKPHRDRAVVPKNAAQDKASRARELLPGDRELQPVYHLTVTAISPSPVDVAVRVLDANDNDPVFERQTYDVTMVETDGASRSAI